MGTTISELEITVGYKSEWQHQLFAAGASGPDIQELKKSVREKMGQRFGWISGHPWNLDDATECRNTLEGRYATDGFAERSKVLVLVNKLIQAKKPTTGEDAIALDAGEFSSCTPCRPPGCWSNGLAFPLQISNPIEVTYGGNDFAVTLIVMTSWKTNHS